MRRVWVYCDKNRSVPSCGEPKRVVKRISSQPSAETIAPLGRWPCSVGWRRLLYELLTGTTPFDLTALREARYGEIQRIIREVDPPIPSTRPSTMDAANLALVAQRRLVEGKALSKLLRGDLDWIVMKALEKDRTLWRAVQSVVDRLLSRTTIKDLATSERQMDSFVQDLVVLTGNMNQIRPDARLG